jgi:acetaldehyde dehydrogenase (acetylating)
MNFQSSRLFITTALILLWPAITPQAAEFGTAEEAKAMLSRAVTAVKNDKPKALAMFNTGASGFKDRDLYVLCANASDGTITASPHNNGSKLTAFSPGQKVMQTATEGKVREITYWWPRPGSIKPLKKHTFYTKVDDQICGVGYWEGSQTAASAEGSKSSSR